MSDRLAVLPQYLIPKQALTVLAGFFVPMHPHFALESIFGFNAWYGFLVCALMIGVAKGLALVLKRPDTYYGKDHD